MLNCTFNSKILVTTKKNSRLVDCLGEEALSCTNLIFQLENSVIYKSGKMKMIETCPIIPDFYYANFPMKYEPTELRFQMSPYSLYITINIIIIESVKANRRSVTFKYLSLSLLLVFERRTWTLLCENSQTCRKLGLEAVGNFSSCLVFLLW